MLHICCQLAGKDSELEETTCLSELLNPVVCSYAYRNSPRVLVMVESCTKMTYMGNTWGTRCIQIWRLAAHKESDFYCNTLPQYQISIIHLLACDSDTWCRSTLIQEDLILWPALPCFLSTAAFVDHSTLCLPGLSASQLSYFSLSFSVGPLTFSALLVAGLVTHIVGYYFSIFRRSSTSRHHTLRSF